MQRTPLRRYLFSVPLTKHISLAPLTICQDPQRGLRQLSSKRGPTPKPNEPKNTSDADDYDDDPFHVKVPWIPGDWLEFGPIRTVTFDKPQTRKSKRTYRLLEKFVDVVFFWALWNEEKITAWILGSKSERTVQAPDFRDLHPIADQNYETSSPSPSSNGGDENGESSDYNFVITPSESE